MKPRSATNIEIHGRASIISEILEQNENRNENVSNVANVSIIV